MVYMVYQQVTTAVREGYRGAHPSVLADHLEEARRARRWLEGLEIDASQRASLVEPIAVVEEAFAELERMAGGGGG